MTGTTCLEAQVVSCGATGPDCVDTDGDGYYGQSATCNPPGGEVDCAPDNPSIHPGAQELCDAANPADEDCDGYANCQDAACRANNDICNTECDKDGDGHLSTSCEGGDDCVDDPALTQVAAYIHGGLNSDTGEPMAETESAAGCTDQWDWDCDGLNNCDDPDCNADPACQVGGGGGSPQPGARYCSGSYEYTDYYYFDSETLEWYYAYTTEEYSVYCSSLNN